MFSLVDDIDFSSFRGSLLRQFEEAWYWFKPNSGGGLHRPDFRGKRRTYKVRKSLYWFKESAYFSFYKKEMVVARARQLAEALCAMGFSVGEIAISDPGEIIWEDTAQILAFPGKKKMPSAFS